MLRICVVLSSCVLVAGCGSRETGAPPPAPVVMPPQPTTTTPAVPPPDPGATVMPADVGALPARTVCVESADGTLLPATVHASIAGVYGPDQPLRLAHLNWMAGGIGCVTYPGASTRSAACGAVGTAPAPVVARTLCQQ